ncbi:MAG TPA: HEAT repeat domain-containing protein [Kofleriaceae bacterium]|jgi:hypothetical protein
MSRASAVIAACLLLTATSAALADTTDTNIAQLHSKKGTYKVRLSAALALSKTHDPRSIIALADALLNDADATVRRVSALALEKMIDGQTPEDAKELGIDALNQASTLDTDEKVRSTAASAMRALASYKKKTTKKVASSNSGPPSSVFVNIDQTIDQSKKLPTGAGARLQKIVTTNVASTGYATSWPGGLPTKTDLDKKQARGFIVASTVKKVEVTKTGTSANVSCSVTIRVSPWEGKDGGEKWEANKAASASGSAKTTTGTRDKDIAGGVSECIEAVAEDVSARQVVPFLKRVALAP